LPAIANFVSGVIQELGAHTLIAAFRLGISAERIRQVNLKAWNELSVLGTALGNCVVITVRAKIDIGDSVATVARARSLLAVLHAVQAIL
jgi:hypothetical protein